MNALILVKYLPLGIHALVLATIYTFLIMSLILFFNAFDRKLSADRPNKLIINRQLPEEALEQTARQRYFAEAEKRGSINLLKKGLAFYRKHFKIKYEHVGANLKPSISGRNFFS